jgi:hypothetical protein
VSRIAKFFRLPSNERFLLVQSALVLVSVRGGLRLLPFKTLIGALARVAPEVAESNEADTASVEKVVWAVEVAGSYLPGTYTCLARALASKVLFGRRGLPGQLRIGVDRDDDGRFQAHAWLESQGRIVIGGEESAQYTPLPAFEWKRP